jgi:hypothetical protein
MWPSIEEVRQWGYDEEADFIEQDEDLLLYGFEYIPVLCQLAADPNCPKNEYAYAVLSQFFRNSIVRGPREDIERFQAVLAASLTRSGYAEKWQAYATRLLQLVQHPSPLSVTEARSFAEDLLLGPGRVGKLSEAISDQEGRLRFTLRTSIMEHVDISLATGSFSYVRQHA